MTCLTMFFAEALTMLALVCSIRGWWPSMFFGLLHFLCLVSPWVRRATNWNNKLPLWAAECQLVYSVSMELKARRDGWPEDQSPEAVMEPIRAGMVSAVFWILVFFCSEMAVANEEEGSDRTEQHKLSQEHVSVTTTTTMVHPPVGVSAPIYQWILPAPSTSMSTPQRGGPTFSAICTVHLDTTTTPTVTQNSVPEAISTVSVTAPRANSSFDDDHGSHHTIAPSTVSSNEGRDHSPALTAMTSPTPEKSNSPLAFNLDHSIPSVVTTTTNSASVTAPLEIETRPVSPSMASKATESPITTPHENSKQPSPTEKNLAPDEHVNTDTDIAGTDSIAVTHDGPCDSQPQIEEVAVEPAPSDFVSRLTVAMADLLHSTEDKGPGTDGHDTTVVLEDKELLDFAARPILASPKRRFMPWYQEKAAKKLKHCHQEKAADDSKEEPSQLRTWYKRRREWL